MKVLIKKISPKDKSKEQRKECFLLDIKKINQCTDRIIKIRENDDKSELPHIQKIWENKDNIKKISEYDFAKIVDTLYELIHNPKVKGGKARTFANLTILEYAEKMGVKLQIDD